MHLPAAARLVRALAGILALLFLSGSPAWADSGDRPAALAGAWYPGTAPELRATLAEYLKLPPGAPPDRVAALLVPHAGYPYSGAVAGAGWALAGRLSPPPRTVILLGPSHRYPLTRPSVWTRGGYETPLGRIPADAKLAADLAAEIGAEFVPQAHLMEHSLEVQMPFIKAALPGASLVTVLTGPPDPAAARRLGRALAAEARGGGVLLVASSDLSHFHDLATAQEMDGRLAARVRALDPGALWDLAREDQAEACGLQGLLAVMYAARDLGAKTGRVLRMDTSAASTGDRTRVVGYLAAAIPLGGAAAPASAAAPPATPVATPAPTPAPSRSELDPAHRKMLLDLARQAVLAAAADKPLPSPPEGDPQLARPTRVFVTLRERGELRGCIGDLSGQRGLGEAVVAMARAAALEDPRFPPVTPAEAPGLTLEISVLTTPEPCTPQEVRVGVDGLMIQKGFHRGLLLPQVPGELGWGREEFLAGLCHKAGLPADAWRDPDTRLWRFQALVFP
ncbi:MAG: AmmeMemoRadiSam system protein B [Deltaproteobacteria bacterium]|nr:AmmeMemoRadiSam system protein B [Deltaproteobacteria bacterium]